jgi:hypothetical protein
MFNKGRRAKDAQPDQAAAVAAVLAEIDTEIDGALSDPHKIWREWAGRAARLPYPTPERSQAAMALLRRHKDRVFELVANDEVKELRRLIGQLDRQLVALTIPQRAPSFEDQVERLMATFRNDSWSSEEVDGIKNLWIEGADIVEIGISGVTLKLAGGQDRKITRAEIRAELAAYGLAKNRLQRLEEREKAALDEAAERAAREESAAS